MFAKIRIIALSMFGAFVVSGPLQHAGALPQTAFGDASKAAIKAALNIGASEAIAACGRNGGGGGGSGGFGGGPQGNNGYGNGGNDGVPGNSGFPDGNR